VRPPGLEPGTYRLEVTNIPLQGTEFIWFIL